MVKNIKQNLDKVECRISEACRSAGRTRSEVTLMAVCKRQPGEAVKAALEAGLTLFGENRVQEAVSKIPAFREHSKWELIGHLQTNKARLAVEYFDRIQSVDSQKLISILARHALELDRARLPMLLQVNAGEDPAKSGCGVGEAPPLVESILQYPHLALDGLMTIAPLAQDISVAQRCFARLRELRDQLEAQFGLSLPVLSMGMSDDMDVAVREGSTLLRVGTAIFGARME